MVNVNEVGGYLLAVTAISAPAIEVQTFGLGLLGACLQLCHMKKTLAVQLGDICYDRIE